VTSDQLPNSITIAKYGRHWAVYADSRLLTVTVYKKGALAVKCLVDTLVSVIHKGNVDRRGSRQRSVQSSALNALDRAAEHFEKHASLPVLAVVSNPCSGRSKVVFHPDCEDGMYHIAFKIGKKPHTLT